MKKQTLRAMPAALSIRAAMTTASALAMSADGAAEVCTGASARPSHARLPTRDPPLRNPDLLYWI